MNFNTTISSVAIILSIGGLIIAMLAHKRNRRIENENYIYKLKIDACHIILKEISELLNLVDGGWHFANSIKVKPTELDLDELARLADEIDEKILNFSGIIAVNSLVLSEKIVSMLDEFSEFLLKSDVGDNDLSKEDEVINTCHKEADRILSEMRKDLNIDTLNVLLFNRIKK